MRLVFDEHGKLDCYLFSHGLEVEITVDEDELHPDDRDTVPTGQLVMEVRVPVLDKYAVCEAAYDVFHRDNGIKRLDDFDIEADDPDMTDLYQRALSEWLTHLGLSMPEGLENEFKMEGQRVAVVLARLERGQVDALSLPKYLERVMTATEWTPEA